MTFVMNQAQTEDADADAPAPRKRGRPSGAKPGPKPGTSTEMTKLSMMLNWWITKHPDRARIHQAIDAVKSLGFLHLVERKTLLFYTLSIVAQSVALDGEDPSDIQEAKEAYNKLPFPEKPGSPSAKAPAKPLTAIEDALLEKAKADASGIVNGANSIAQRIKSEVVEECKRLLEAAKTESRDRMAAAKAEAQKIINDAKATARQSKGLPPRKTDPGSGAKPGFTWHNDGVRNRGVRNGEMPPDGFTKGRLQSPGNLDGAAKGREVLLHHPELRQRGPRNGHWWTDGSQNIYVKDVDTPPEGFWRGKPVIYINGGPGPQFRSWYTDGTKSVKVKHGDEPPPGFQKGRTMKNGSTTTT